MSHDPPYRRTPMYPPFDKLALEDPPDGFVRLVLFDRDAAGRLVWSSELVPIAVHELYGEALTLGVWRAIRDAEGA